MPINCSELLKNFEEKMEGDTNYPGFPPAREGQTLGIGKILHFSGVDGRDVYNITAPFRINDTMIIAGRVEAREACAESYIVFFEEKNEVWVPVSDAPIFQLEDGFITTIDEEMIFGGIEIYPRTDSRHVGYRTVFYRGKDLQSLKKFAVGPDIMKGVRIIRLTNGRIGVFTRPHGELGGRGKIGYIEIQNLEDLNAEVILQAKIIENQFIPEEWGGVNELYLLPDGKIGALGHIACFGEDEKKHYYAMSFVYDPTTHSASLLQIIATRKNFPASDNMKIPGLEDILYPGGLIHHENHSATLYVGLSDVMAGCITILDPFEF